MSHKPQIMVVDDDQAICEFLRMFLDGLGYRGIAVNNAEQAVQLYNADRPDAVIIDVIMPGSMDGLVLASEIRQKYNNLPVLFMTGALLESDEYAAEMAGKKLLLRKPFSAKALIEFIDSHLGES